MDRVWVGFFIKEENLVGLLSLDREFCHGLIGAARLLTVVMVRKERNLLKKKRNEIEREKRLRTIALRAETNISEK